MLTPPADRPKTRPYRLIVTLGLTALLYFIIARQFGEVVAAITSARVG